MNSKRLSLLVSAAAIAAMLLWPAQAFAQHGHGGRPGGGHPGGYPGGVYRGGGTHVSVGVGFGYGWGYPYYYSPFYHPFYFGVGFGWYSGYWGPWGGWPYYGYAPYPYAGYPYGYYGWSSVRVEVKPREAQVFVDGYFTGIVDNFDGVFQRLDVAPGGHEIAIYLQGYQTYREKMMFAPGNSYHIKTVLQPLPAGAPQEPPPQPAPGSQNLNGYGQRPPNAYGPNGYGPNGYPPPQPPNGYGTEPRDPYGPPPQGGEARTVPMPERRAPRGNTVELSDFGTLTLRVQPGDAVVTIDGERWDSPDSGSRLVVQLAPGQHRVEVQKDGYRPYSTTIEVRPGEPQTLNISLPQQ